MNKTAWIGIGAVALIGAVLATVALVWTGPDTTAAVAPDVKVPGVAMEPVVELHDAPYARATAPPRPSDAAATPFPTDGLGPELLALHPDFEAAMNRVVTLGEIAPDAPPQEADRQISEELLGLVSTIQGAADAHLTFAETAPRPQATLARERAAQLYQHLSDSIREVPVAPGLPAAEAELHRTARERMAESHARKAAVIRAQGG